MISVSAFPLPERRALAHVLRETVSRDMYIRNGQIFLGRYVLLILNARVRAMRITAIDTGATMHDQQLLLFVKLGQQTYEGSDAM